MAEEGLTKTPNELIHIGKPVEFDADRLFEALSMIMLVAYENSEAVKLLMEMMVKTYKPSEKLSMEQKAQYDKDIARILRKYGR